MGKQNVQAKEVYWMPSDLIREVSAMRISKKRNDTSVVEQELKPPRSTHGFFFHSSIYFSMYKDISSHRMYLDSVKF